MSKFLGQEATLLDVRLARHMQDADRDRVWQSADNILAKAAFGKHCTGLALGYVQSGKTTQMMALAAAAKDRGTRVIIAFLGGTNLLLDQNVDRFIKAFEFETRTDYQWIVTKNPAGDKVAAQLQERLEQGRTLFIPVLKHSGRLGKLADVLSKLDLAQVEVLVMDDEADQASMNAKVNQDEESKTYSAIKQVRNSLPNHLYVQFTATPYAPLLLETDNHLMPEFVEFLTPGAGYTGGKEFFVDHANEVLRTIPALDEQAANARNLLSLPDSLVSALANFFVGSALLHRYDAALKPISMLIHSSHSNVIQSKYHFLAMRLKESWRQMLEVGLPREFAEERLRLISNGVVDLPDSEFRDALVEVMSETTFWLVNSVSDVKKIKWNESPFHVLIGGNKLDRGFTVEGLTVTYMNRPSSDQIDTLEQRARAFGYRNDLIPYCQFFGTAQTLRLLKGVVATEYDLRARLGDWLEIGGTPSGWAKEIGLLLPQGAKPTRSAVIKALNRFNGGNGWHSLRRPTLEDSDFQHNRTLIANIGLLNAERTDYGRIHHRETELSVADALALLRNWRWGTFSPGWDYEAVLDSFERIGVNVISVPLTLMQYENEDRPRERSWTDAAGFNNLFQGKDLNMQSASAYAGDAAVPFGTDESHDARLAIQVHYVRPKGVNIDVYTLAIFLGGQSIVKRRTL